MQVTASIEDVVLHSITKYYHKAELPRKRLLMLIKLMLTYNVRLWKLNQVTIGNSVHGLYSPHGHQWNLVNLLPCLMFNTQSRRRRHGAVVLGLFGLFSNALFSCCASLYLFNLPHIIVQGIIKKTNFQD